MKHDWRKDEYGDVDEWAWSIDYHNGPVCKRCGHRPCVNCTPDWDTDDCKVALPKKTTTISENLKAYEYTKNTDYLYEAIKLIADSLKKDAVSEFEEGEN